MYCLHPMLGESLVLLQIVEHYLHNEEVTLLMLVSQIVVCICIARAIKQVKESIHMVACCIVAGGVLWPLLFCDSW